MGKPTGFMEYPRRKTPWRDPVDRALDYYEIYTPAEEEQLKKQGARCMNCGVPFCESEHGCPIDNLIPEWNDLVYKGEWKEAYQRLTKTNNFPEFTGRVCPAPCEGACVLGINEPAVTIKDIENSIIDRAFEEGWVKAEPPENRTNYNIAVIGSGPAGLAAAAQLNKAGHNVRAPGNRRKANIRLNRIVNIIKTLRHQWRSSGKYGLQCRKVMGVSRSDTGFRGRINKLG